MGLFNQIYQILKSICGVCCAQKNVFTIHSHRLIALFENKDFFWAIVHCVVNTKVVEMQFGHYQKKYSTQFSSVLFLFYTPSGTFHVNFFGTFCKKFTLMTL